ncbi:MAG: methyltransferase domain-containing protein [Acidobacteria bacterium]|nr:MAG: methyltransferase domain-containing protein [Acidobacteriota bacterium]
MSPNSRSMAGSVQVGAASNRSICMPRPIEDQTLLCAPAFAVHYVAEGVVALDPAGPHWIGTDERGLRLLGRFDGRTPFAQVVRDYATESGLDVARAWLHVETFAHDALRHRFLSTDGAAPAPYLGRSAYLETERLQELWIQVNDFCNLSCGHCLVSSGPERQQGLPTERITDAIDQAIALGVERLFFTGGEPLARPDILDLAERVVTTHHRELVILTNGTLFKGDRLERLSRLVATPPGPSDVEGSTLGPAAAQGSDGAATEGRAGLRIQISLDGPTAEINDPIRGAGTFERIVDGLDLAVEAGLRPTLTSTILRDNLGSLNAIVQLAAAHGVRNVHLLWPHRRGRVLDGALADLPTAEEILAAVRRARVVATELGVSIDNLEEFRLRLDGAPGVKNDLAGAGWSSLCLYTDGCVYPSASMAGVPELRCGDLGEQNLETIWKTSAVCRDLRDATVVRKPLCRSCSLRFLCGGGDVEHGYWPAAAEGQSRRSAFVGHDPYCELYKGLAEDTFADLLREGRATVQPRSGYDRPVVVRAMGEHTLHDEDAIVRTTHSACVLSEEVLDKSRLTVREFYGEAAEQPHAELCCPVQPDAADLEHIPKAVVERFYGCGSPVRAASLVAGESMVDLGSGAGIDCFIAAKQVGSEGRVYGIDMTDQMLSVARECQPQVAEALGYDAVEFRKGYLEEIPLEDATADVVTSNCVINLSPDKPRVFREIWRVLKDYGRLVVADIVSDHEVPPKMRADGRLWGECISGALTEEAFLAGLEKAGFYGVSVLTKSFWREVEGCKFYSVTVRGYKFEKTAGCRFVGQYAVYLGPQKAVVDEEGHLFPRGEAVEVCTDTAAKLSHAPYAGSFAIVDGPTGSGDVTASDDDAGCGCGPECC